MFKFKISLPILSGAFLLAFLAGSSFAMTGSKTPPRQIIELAQSTTETEKSLEERHKEAREARERKRAERKKKRRKRRSGSFL